MDGYRFKMGWMLVAFDLPVGTRKQMKAASDFRKFLKRNGFLMVQFSVYAREIVSHARMETHIRRIRAEVPPQGCVRALYITHAQWRNTFIIHNGTELEEPPEDWPEQLELW